MAVLRQPNSHTNPFSEQIGDALAPAGTYVATVIDIRDEFGIQRQRFQSTETEKVDLTCFLFGFRDAQGAPHRMASRMMRISGNEKAALFNFLKSLLGRAPAYGWDYCSLKGQKCLLTVEHVQKRDGSGMFAAIAALSPVPDGFGVPAAPNPAAAPAPRPQPAPAAAPATRPAAPKAGDPLVEDEVPFYDLDPNHAWDGLRVVPASTPTTMAVLTKNKVPSGHWYRCDGTPVHRLPTADGQGERPTTLRDAKRLKLYPSVTSILGILAKPGLEKWKLDQVALASLRTPKQAEESEDYWCGRVRNAAFEQVEEAADLGTMIHGALELAMAGEPFAQDLRPYVEPVLEWKARVGIQIIEREVRVVNRAEGFAGTSDVLFRYGQNGIGILDYKTRKTRKGEAVEAYDNQAMQLAAYGATYWGPENVERILAANVFISTTEPGRIEVVKHETLARDWKAFRLVAALWRYQKGYDPREANGAPAT